MCDEQVLSLQTILLSIGTRGPKIILQSVDDICIYPAVMGSVVSVVVLCVMTKKCIKFTVIYTVHCDGNYLYAPTNACKM